MHADRKFPPIPESNDLALQLRKRGVSQIVLAGMAANLCVESHLRHLLEEGFEVVVVAMRRPRHGSPPATRTLRL
jgi:nicotinamidase-related amidase